MVDGEEFRYRFGKTHRSAEVISCLLPYIAERTREVDNINAAASRAHEMDFTALPVHAAYQAYLNARWTTTDRRLPAWTRRNPPAWSCFQALEAA